ncbi:MAG: gamma-glutamyltransferase [Alphaproteobacteria bacterium]|nr:gamma-glutamyltransferase [Alphaproteobacteria bacterium]
MSDSQMHNPVGDARRGAVAAGDSHTANAAGDVLADGGNAFDAVLAGLFTACIAEPVLCSLGGGGFLLAQPGPERGGVQGTGDAVLYDFFCQTPGRLLPVDELEFLPVHADFGSAQQEFHIGMGAVAVPGLVAGAFAIHADLCTLPMARLVEPAVALARGGVALASLQSFILEAVAPIMQWSAESRALYDSPSRPEATLRPGETLALPALAELLEALAREGAGLFYRGEVAQAIAAANRDCGGAVSLDDLESYRVVRRLPLTRRFGEVEIMGNPAPSSGGPLLAFTLGLLAETELGLGTEYVRQLAVAMELTDQARRAAGLNHGSDQARVASLLSEPFMAEYLEQMPGRAGKTGGTTHISVVDRMGNAAALSVSNGEGCGHILPIGNVMLNNMLGEEDLNPNGFFQWQANSRITSMMSPTLVRRKNGGTLALGSGGSNRIRSAILQVLLNHLCLGMSLEDAVTAPRIHMDRQLLHLEGGHDGAAVRQLAAEFPAHQIWPERNFFFGGVHGAAFDPDSDNFTAAGDPRRGGSVA